MTAKIIDGKAIGEDIRNEVAAGVQERLKAGKSTPGVGNRFGR